MLIPAVAVTFIRIIKLSCNAYEPRSMHIEYTGYIVTVSSVRSNTALKLH